MTLLAKRQERSIVPRMYYITTAIDYTNGPPHIGHAYEKVLADVLARWHRMKGEEVYFLTGVDQHGQKVQQTAEKLGITPQEHVNNITEQFLALWNRLGISNDGWASTTDPRHKACVQKILTDLKDKGQLYKKSYKGFYSVRQEQFLTDKERDAEGNFGPEWGEVVELEEENWYFRLTDHVEWMKQFVEKSSDFVLPSFRKAEVLNAIDFDSDLCISRPKSRLSWGIEFPFDPEFVTYVWFDALINYISFAGYLAEPDSGLPEFSKLWPADCEVIGKDILVPAHGVYWPAMLHAMGFSDEEMPTLLVHGWWNINGEKMSKSIGNVVDPNLLAEQFGPEPVRYYLVRDITTGKDANFDADRLVMLYNTELANDLGNLCNRSINMTRRYCDSVISGAEAYDDEASKALRSTMDQAVTLFSKYMDDNMASDALAALNAQVSACNAYIEQQQPWQLAKDEASAPRPRAAPEVACPATGRLAAYLNPRFAGAKQEKALLLSLDSRSRVKSVYWLKEGNTRMVSLEVKDVVSAALRGGTESVVLCHNHPNGVALPSLEDMDATGSIARALGLVNVHLLDHFILTDTEYFSMRDANRLPIYDFKTGTLFWP